MAEVLARIVVLGHSQDEVCTRGWGPRRSSAETTRLVQGYIERIYGDRVSVDYYDAAEPQVTRDFAGVVAQAQERYWPYPLVLFNDKPVMAGHVDSYGLLGLLREELGQA